MGHRGNRTPFKLRQPRWGVDFDYYTRLARNARADTWRYHSLSQAREHFAKFRSSEVYFSLRLDARLLGRMVFSRAATHFASVVSTKFDLGGELVAFVHV